MRPVASQVDDLLGECKKVTEKGGRVLVTTLTKRMAEDLSEYIEEAGIKVQYLHSDIDTLERVEIIRNLRHGIIEVLIGVNLLREGLDIPECKLVAILDADKEGFLRSKTALIQTIGRAARNVDGRVILYADVMTKSLKGALEETEARRNIQIEHNKKHGITPASIIRAVSETLRAEEKTHEEIAPADNTIAAMLKDHKSLEKTMEKMKKQMLKHASNLEFEEAAKLRDQLHQLEKIALT